MLEITPESDRALLIGLARRASHVPEIEEHLEELARLADTAGAEIAESVLHKLNRPNPATLVGAGKVKELKAAAAHVGANLAIFDDELSPTQGKNLEDALGVRVMDRSELILDIFATRARTREAKLQVELAQLEYMLPRLARMWTHLSRIRGGIGLRGPGETQIETDRRLIRRRMGTLRKRLQKVSKHRDNIRRHRPGVLTAALVGYTNAGKSSLLNALTGANAFAEDRLFATLDTKSRETVIDGARVRLIDTVGFIRKLPVHLVASFRSTLEQADQADLLLHVVDASDEYWEDHLKSAEVVLDDLDLLGKPRALVFNKVDLLDAGDDPTAWVVDGELDVLPASAQESDLGAVRDYLVSFATTRTT